MTSETIAHYRLVRRLGGGGMGEVYLAQDTKLDRPVALKVMSEELARDDNQRRRFRTEAKAASGLSHPNVCVVHEVGETEDGRPFLAMEYVEGKPLEALLQQRRVRIREVIRIGIQVAQALEAAHARGIVHRDIKPGNVMLDGSGNSKVLDFGLAKRVGIEDSAEASSAARTRTGMLIGTPHYMSPEQALGHELDGRSDLFSLGVLLYEMLAGQKPFLGKTVGEVINNIVNQQPEPLGLENPLFSPALDEIVFKCLAKDRTQRYQTAAEVRADLEKLKAVAERAGFGDMPSVVVGAAGQAETARPPTKLWQLASGSGRRATANRVLAGIVIGLLLLAGGFYALHRFQAGTALKGVSGRAVLKGVPEKSIAVLPFDNFSAESDTDYLSDGLTEEITTALSRVTGLKVAARNSAYAFKGRKEDVRRIGEALRVNTVLEGSLRKDGNRIRVTAQLINIADGFHLWSEVYERPADDLFAVQEDIATRIVERLQGTNANAIARAGGKGVEPQAHKFYLQARVYWNKRTDADLRKAIELFNAATNKDPTYAAAYAGLAATYVLLPGYARMSDVPVNPKEYWPLVRAAAGRALELDPACAEAYAALAEMEIGAHDYKNAETHFRRAIELAPNYATAHHWYGQFLNITARWEEGYKELQMALDLDPMSPIIRCTIPEWYFLNGAYDRALDGCQKAVQDFPNFPMARGLLIKVQLKKGLYQEALGEIEKVRQLLPDDPLAYLEAKGYALARLGQPEEARKILALLQEHAKQGHQVEMAVFGLYLGLREYEKALDILEAAYEKDGMEEIVLCNPFNEEFGDNPRFKALKARALQSLKLLWQPA